MPQPTTNDSKRQLIHTQPTAYVRKVIAIGSTRYVAIPPPLADALNLRPHDFALWLDHGENRFTLEKHSNGPRHA